MNIDIRQAELKHLENILPLFDAYRVFHKQSSDLEAARIFLSERLQSQEAKVFVAYSTDDAKAVGFALFYQTYSSHSMKRVVILNDLYTVEAYRGQGVAQALVKEVIRYAKNHKAATLRLFTTIDNLAAKRFYEYLGFTQNTGFAMYNLHV